MENLIRRLAETTQALADAYKHIDKINLYYNLVNDENKQLKNTISKKKEDISPIYIREEVLEYLQDWLCFIEKKEIEDKNSLVDIHDAMAFIENIVNTDAVEIICEEEEEDEEGFTY